MPYTDYERPPKQPLTKEVALKKAQSWCAYQDRCHEEARTKLLEWGQRGYDLEDIIASLIEERFLDEERFARSFARGKFRMKEWGRIKIRLALQQKRVGAYCLRAAMSEINDVEYRETIVSVYRKYLSLHPDTNTTEQHHKAVHYLLSRGFEYEVITETLADVKP